MAPDAATGPSPIMRGRATTGMRTATITPAAATIMAE
jgi:hypothetical protein